MNLDGQFLEAHFQTQADSDNARFEIVGTGSRRSKYKSNNSQWCQIR
jgi:hypothetical protein